MINTETNKDMDIKVTNIEVIEDTIQSDKATIITLDKDPSIEEENNLFGNDKSIVLEF